MRKGRPRRLPYFLGNSLNVIHGIGKSGKSTAPRRNQVRSERPRSAAYVAVNRPAKSATARMGIAMKMIQDNIDVL